jgi:hypothetical protein
MSIRLVMEESNPDVEKVLIALQHIPPHRQIETLEVAVAWLKTVRRPRPLTFTNPHTSHLQVGDGIVLDASNPDTLIEHLQPEQSDPLVRR